MAATLGRRLQSAAGLDAAVEDETQRIAASQARRPYDTGHGVYEAQLEWHCVGDVVDAADRCRNSRYYATLQLRNDAVFIRVDTRRCSIWRQKVLLIAFLVMGSAMVGWLARGVWTAAPSMP